MALERHLFLFSYLLELDDSETLCQYGKSPPGMEAANSSHSGGCGKTQVIQNNTHSHQGKTGWFLAECRGINHRGYTKLKVSISVLTV